MVFVKKLKKLYVRKIENLKRFLAVRWRFTEYELNFRIKILATNLQFSFKEILYQRAAKKKLINFFLNGKIAALEITNQLSNLVWQRCSRKKIKYPVKLIPLGLRKLHLGSDQWRERRSVSDEQMMVVATFLAFRYSSSLKQFTWLSCSSILRYLRQKKIIFIRFFIHKVSLWESRVINLLFKNNT